MMFSHRSSYLERRMLIDGEGAGLSERQRNQMLAASIPAPARSKGMQLSVLVPTCVAEISYVQSDLWTGVALAANFVTSRGDEGRFFASDGKDHANTRRVLSQRWVPLGENERSFARLSVSGGFGVTLSRASWKDSVAPARSRMPALFAAAASAPVRPSAARAAHRELALAPTFVSGQ